MGKYDELIGGFHITISVDDILAEQETTINTRKKLVEELIALTEKDIEIREKPVFSKEEGLDEEITYLKSFRSHLKEYLERL